MRIHIVKKGDTLWKIAKQYGVGFEELKKMNTHLPNPDYILPGMEIRIPDSNSTQSTRPTSSQPRREGFNTNGTNQNQQQGTNQQRTSKEQLTRPIEDFILPQGEARPLTTPAKKEQLTAPIQQKPAPKKKLTAPIKEVKPPKEVETAPKPVEIKPPIMPQFHFDFAPQFHHQPQPMQPQPQPMQPQPIFIEMPQAQQPIYIEMPPTQQPVEQVKEYIPIQQPHYVYIPYFLGYMPCPEIMPCHEPCECHHVEQMPPPCPCNQMYPYSENTHFPMNPEMINPNMMPQQLGNYEDSSDYGAVEIDLNSIEEGLPNWLEKDSTSSSSRRRKMQQGLTEMSPYQDESISKKRKTKHRSESYPFLNPNPYSPWNF